MVLDEDKDGVPRLQGPSARVAKPLASHFVPTIEDDLKASELEEEQEALYSDGNSTRIRVTQAPGYLCHIEATAKMPVPADLVWRQCIIHPHNAKIYRHMERQTYRKVLAAQPGKRTMEVEHEASWRFFIFHGKIKTRLKVEEDDVKRCMRFELLPCGGIMEKFQGCWRIDDCLFDPGSSISTLSQDLAIGVPLPRIFNTMLKRVSCTQVKKIVEDVRRECHLISEGRPTLCPYDEVETLEVDLREGCDEGSIPH